MPGLGFVSGVLRWIEELLTIVNGPLLMFGGGIALVDLLTDGALVSSDRTLLYAWAVSQAVGVDTQLLGCFSRARESAHAKRWGAVFGWVVLGGVLAVFAGQSMYVFAIQQSEHLSEAQALARLHLDPLWWYGERAALAVGLIALSGWTRYRKPVLVDVAARMAAIEQQRQVEAAEAELRAQRLRLMRRLVSETLRGDGDANAGGDEGANAGGDEDANAGGDEGANAGGGDANAGGGDAVVDELTRLFEESARVSRRSRAKAGRSSSRSASAASVAQTRRQFRVATVAQELRENPRLTVATVARQFGISASTASAIIHAARERLRGEQLQERSSVS